MNAVYSLVFYVEVLWHSVKSNPVFVAFSSAFLGALGDSVFDVAQTGHFDFSAAGVHKLIAAAIGSGVIAVVHLYRPTPEKTPNPNHT